MKKVIFISILLIAFSTVKAQEIPFLDFGVKAGLSAASLNNLDDGIENDGLKYGLTAGPFLRLKLPVIGIYVQTEAMITQMGGKYKAGNQKGQIDITTLDIPILLGSRVGLGAVGARFNVGGVISNVLSSKVKINGRTVDTKEDTSKRFFGAQIGFGLDVSKLSFDLKYHYNFTDMSTIDGENTKTATVLFTVGYTIF